MLALQNRTVASINKYLSSKLFITSFVTHQDTKKKEITALNRKKFLRDKDSKVEPKNEVSKKNTTHKHSLYRKINKY